MSVKLSDRLKLIAGEVRPGESVSDIGTDHGFIPAYLAENGISQRIIMTDISQGSLEKAIADVKEILPDDSMVEARLGDGLSPIGEGECDTVIIAGMGGLTMIEILDWDLMKTRSFRRFILQPRRDAGELRKWLLTNGFVIEKNMIVREGRHIPEIITARPAAGESSDISDIKDKEIHMFDYPDGIVAPLEPGLVGEYLRSELEKAEAISEKIRRSKGSHEEKLDYIGSRVRRLAELCKKTDS